MIVCACDVALLSHFVIMRVLKSICPFYHFNLEWKRKGKIPFANKEMFRLAAQHDKEREMRQRKQKPAFKIDGRSYLSDNDYHKKG